MKKYLIVVLNAVILFFNPVRNFGQSPNLGTASSFALFTAVGAFTNVGTTNITGNIGTNSGALTGFPPGTINGQTHVADAISAQVATDVISAYTYLSNVTCGVTISTNLGNGQTLTPNIYCLGAASTITGDLTLDAQGNPNAIFIFKINGALSIIAACHVILINSASIDNVFWQSNGAVDIGGSSVFTGNIFTNGAISLAEGAKLTGRGFTTQGAINLQNVIVINPSAVVAPVTLTAFSGVNVRGNNEITWQTTAEFNALNFVLERSITGLENTFSEIATLRAVGVSSSFRTYNFVDSNVSKIYNYRLRSNDIDGAFTYSKVISIALGVKSVELKSGVSNIFPNPVIDKLNVSFTLSRAENINVLISDVYGRIMYNQNIALELGITISPIPTSNLVSGIYSLICSFNGEIKSVNFMKE